MLGGGGVLNWSFIQAGMCDELSVVVAASADCASDTPALSRRAADMHRTTPWDLNSSKQGLFPADASGCAIWSRIQIAKIPLDADEDVDLSVPGDKWFKETTMGKNLINYNSMLVPTRLKATRWVDSAVR